MSELCPLDSRRSMKELWSKLALAHFTSIFAFCHLHSIRGERIISSKLLFYILTPYVICLQYGLALLILMCTSCIDLIMKEPKRSKLLVRRKIKILFGSDDRYINYECHPLNLDVLPTSLEHPHPAGSRPTTKIIGRLVVILLFSVQCIGSIILFVRRCRYNAATENDYRVLEVACGGLTVAILTLLFLMGQSCIDREELSSSEHFSGPESAIHWLRDSPVRNDRYRSVVLWILRNVIASLIFLIKPTSQSNLLSRIMFTDPVYLFSLLSIPACVFVYIHEIWKWKFSPWVEESLVIFGICLLLPFFFFLFYSIMFTWVDNFHTWQNISIDIENLQEWPTNITCPGHWQEPLASWLWNLI